MKPHPAIKKITFVPVVTCEMTQISACEDCGGHMSEDNGCEFCARADREVPCSMEKPTRILTWEDTRGLWYARFHRPWGGAVGRKFGPYGTEGEAKRAVLRGPK